MGLFDTPQDMTPEQFKQYRASLKTKVYTDGNKAGRKPTQQIPEQLRRKYDPKKPIRNVVELVRTSKQEFQLQLPEAISDDVKFVGAVRIEVETWNCTFCECDCAGEKYLFGEHPFCSMNCALKHAAELQKKNNKFNNKNRQQ